MADPIEKLLPRFRYGVIHPRANEEFQRGPAYQLYRLVPLDVMEISTGLGLENYTPDGVEKAVGLTLAGGATGLVVSANACSAVFMVMARSGMGLRLT